MDEFPRGYLLAFDYGLRHVGVAVGQSVTGTASPVTTLQAVDGRVDPSALKALTSAWQPSALVVGLPLNMDGTASDMSKRASHFAQWLAKELSLPVHLVDERLTTREAQTIDKQAHRSAKSATDVHALAAVLIAECYYSSGAAGRPNLGSE